MRERSQNVSAVVADVAVDHVVAAVPRRGERAVEDLDVAIIGQHVLRGAIERFDMLGREPRKLAAHRRRDALFHADRVGALLVW